MSGPSIRLRERRDLKYRRHRSHSCWDHLLAAPLWPMHGVNLGTLLRTCDAVGACLAVPRHPWIPASLAREAIRLADLAPARGRTIAVLGNENTGIPPEVLDLLDAVVEIPMVGTGHSLNVAVAGSLVLYRLAGLI